MRCMEQVSASLTSQYNTEQYSNDKIEDCHTNNNAEDGDIFRFAYTMAGIPYSFTHKIDTEHQDECTDDHNGDIADGCCPCHHDHGGGACEQESSEASSSSNAIE